MATNDSLTSGRAAAGTLTILPALIDNILGVLGDCTLECDAVEREQFRAEIASYRARIVSATENRDLAGVTSSCVATCERYFVQVKQYYRGREAELTELIDLLREAAGLLVRQSSDFNARVLTSTDHFSTFAELDDMKELRRQITEEVSILRQTVSEKQQQDDDTYRQLSTRVQTLQSKLAHAEEEATLDALTRVANRGGFDRALEQAVQTSRTSGNPLTLALIDIDTFKQINDERGHLIGDRVLLGTAQWLRRQVRSTDFVARYGGDEFAVLLPGIRAGQAKARLERILGELADRCYEYEADGAKRSVSWTTSCGVATFETKDTIEVFVSRTDQALYEAKRGGRNKVVARGASFLGGLLAR